VNDVLVLARSRQDVVDMFLKQEHEEGKVGVIFIENKTKQTPLNENEIKT
jgi:hypothetical protein